MANKIILGSVEQTTDYDMFSIIEDNRALNENHLKKLTESVAILGANVQAIIVTAEFDVLDGMHRLEGCKRANVPVNYIVANTDKFTNEEIMIALNINSKNWSLEDYVKHYAHTKDEYNTILVSAYDKKIGVLAAIDLIGITQDMAKSGKRFDVPSDYNERVEDLINLRETYKLWTGKALRSHSCAMAIRDIKDVIASKIKRGDTLVSSFKMKRAIKNIPKVCSSKLGISEDKATIKKVLSDAHDYSLGSDKKVYLL